MRMQQALDKHITCLCKPPMAVILLFKRQSYEQQLTKIVLSNESSVELMKLYYVKQRLSIVIINAKPLLCV